LRDVLDEIYGSGIPRAEQRRLGAIAVAQAQRPVASQAQSSLDLLEGVLVSVRDVSGLESKPGVGAAKRWLRDHGAAPLAARVSRLSKTRNGVGHPDVALADDIRGKFAFTGAQPPVPEPEEEHGAGAGSASGELPVAWPSSRSPGDQAQELPPAPTPAASDAGAHEREAAIDPLVGHDPWAGSSGLGYTVVDGIYVDAYGYRWGNLASLLSWQQGWDTQSPSSSSWGGARPRRKGRK